jgi:hypothetical protein
MATSTNKAVFTNLTYNDTIKNEISKSGGTIVFVKDNIIVASEVSEATYRTLLSQVGLYIDKIDILPLKRYANEGVKIAPSESNSILPNTNINSD